MKLQTFIKNQTRLKLSGVEIVLQEFADLMLLKEDYELSILFCGNTQMKYLNRTYRNKIKTTDVLSFEADIPGILGDIVISIPQAKKQAKQGLKYELEMLLCHGFLHLLGYDHEKSEQDYKLMINYQTQLLDKKQMEIILL